VVTAAVMVSVVVAWSAPAGASTNAGAGSPPVVGRGWAVPSTPPRAAPFVNSNGEQGISVARDRDGRLEAFCGCGPLSGLSLLHTYQLVPNGGWAPWSSWGLVDGLIDPHVVMNGDGRLEVFLHNTNGIVHAWQLSPGGPWSDLAQLTSDGAVVNAAVTTQADGRVEVFFQHATGTAVVEHLWQTTPGGAWSAPVALNPALIPTGTLTVFQDANEDVELFAYGSGETVLYHAKWVASAGVWTFDTFGVPALNWVGVPQDQMAVALNADGRAEAFLSSTEGVYHMWQQTPGGAWSGLVQLTQLANLNVAVGRNLDGRLELVYVSDPGSATPLHRWQVAPGAGWSDDSNLDNSTGRLFGAAMATVNDADGRLETFLVGSDTSTSTVQILHAWQTRAGNGPWTNLLVL
jgi:hypothetical protein